MTIDETRDLEAELLDALGEERLIELAEKIGGFRFYVPRDPDASADRYNVGRDVLGVLSGLYGGENIIIPLAKRLRAQRMWADNRSYAEIARALTMTESGVFKLLKRSPRPPRKARADDRQMKLL